ncbi:MAG: hypothetical protein QXK84_07415 [Nitrososphaerota archaeon]
MTEGEDARIKEAKRQLDEAIRALSVALAKKAHATIEYEEARRRLPEAISIIMRINDLRNSLDKSLKLVDDLLKKTPEVFSLEASHILRKILEDLFSTYASIREDFKRSLELTDDYLMKLFPWEPPRLEESQIP